MAGFLERVRDRGLTKPRLLLEAALSLDAAELKHLVDRTTPRGVPLPELLGRITLPFTLEALPLAPALCPTFLLLSHDRPPDVLGLPTLRPAVPFR
jgi:hypothetical protein